MFFLFSIKKNKRRFYRSRVSVPSDFRKAGMKKAGASRLFPGSEELGFLFEDGRRGGARRAVAVGTALVLQLAAVRRHGRGLCSAT